MKLRMSMLFLIAATSLVLAPIVCASDFNKSQNIGSYQEWYVYIKLNDGDYVTGNYTVSAISEQQGEPSSSEVYFSVENSQDNKILDYGLVGGANTFNFTAQGSGTYTLNFSNPFDFMKIVSLSVHAPDQEPAVPTGSFFLTYALFGLAIFSLVVVVGLAIYAIAKSSVPKGLTGLEREVKVLGNKFNFALLGAGVGVLLVVASLAYIYTPYYVWGTFIPDTIMQVIDPSSQIIAIVSLFSVFVGFGLVFGMIAALAHYGKKLKQAKDQMQSTKSTT